MNIVNVHIYMSNIIIYSTLPRNAQDTCSKKAEKPRIFSHKSKAENALAIGSLSMYYKSGGSMISPCDSHIGTYCSRRKPGAYSL